MCYVSVCEFKDFVTFISRTALTLSGVFGIECRLHIFLVVEVYLVEQKHMLSLF